MQQKTKSIVLKINPEYEKLVPPLGKDEYRSLKDSINKYGMLNPVSYNNNFEILDGHHRMLIAKELKIPIKTEEKPLIFPNKLRERLWVVDANLERRQLSKFQNIELRIRKKPLLVEIAKLNMSLGGKLSGKKLKGVKNFTPLKRVNEKLGKECGVSYATVHKVQTLLENSDDDQLEKLRTGKLSISRAFTNYNRSQDHVNTPKLPQGKFDVILSDCPWKMDIQLRARAEQHYPTMDTEKIAELRIPSADNAVLFLWATQPMIKEALYVMDRWNFQYKSGVVWVKDKIGTGNYFRFKHELLLLGIKGDMPIPNEADRPDSVINAPRTKHSKKPDIVYEMIERMYPNRKYLELFARNKRKDWTSWGNEINQLSKQINFCSTKFNRFFD